MIILRWSGKAGERKYYLLSFETKPGDIEYCGVWIPYEPGRSRKTVTG